MFKPGCQFLSVVLVHWSLVYVNQFREKPDPNGVQHSSYPHPQEQQGKEGVVLDHLSRPLYAPSKEGELDRLAAIKASVFAWSSGAFSFTSRRSLTRRAA